VNFFKKLKLPSVVALTLVMLLVVGVFYGLGWIVYSAGISFVQGFPQYASSLQTTWEEAIAEWEIPSTDIQQYLTQFNWREALGKLPISDTLFSTFGAFAGFLGNAMLILFFTAFFLSGAMRIGSRINQAFSQKHTEKILHILNSILKNVQTYLSVKLLINLAISAIAVIILMFFNVDLALFSGLLFFVLSFIPNIGSIVATAFCLVICFLQYGLSWKLPGLALILISLQTLLGDIVEPLIMGRGLNLSPIVLVLSLIFWGWVWGLIGMILAVPLTATVVIIFENIESLRPIAILMKGGKG
jgi:predicted PurR-regulated permease PerM